MNSAAAWSHDVARNPPALLMALDGDGHSQRLPRDILEVWYQATRDAEQQQQQRLHPTSQDSETSARAPTAAAAPKPLTQKLDTAEFFALSAELERVNRDIESSRPVELHERVRKLAVDELDQHMFDTLAPSQRAVGRDVVRLFAAHQYEAALQAMLHVVNECATEKRTASMFNNEAVCYFKLERWLHSKQATDRALSLYQDLEVCRRRLTRVALALGDLSAAKAEALPFKQAPQWAAEWRAIKCYEAYTLLFDSQQYVHALRELESLLTVFPCATFESLKVRLVSLESNAEAVVYARDAHQRYPFSSDLQFWQAELAFHSASTSTELHDVGKMFHAATAPKTDTRFRMAELRVRANLSTLTTVEELLREGQWELLVATCSTFLEQRHTLHDGMKLALYAARAEAHAHVGDWYAGLDDALRATSYAETTPKKAALLLLASQCEEGLQRFKDALEHAQQSQRLAPCAATGERVRLLQAAFTQHTQKRQAQQERTKAAAAHQPDPGAGGRSQSASSSPPQLSARPHYQVLGVSESSNTVEVRRAYRALAMRWHPDKWSGASTAEVALAEQRFKEIQNAYETVMNRISS